MFSFAINAHSFTNEMTVSAVLLMFKVQHDTATRYCDLVEVVEADVLLFCSRKSPIYLIGFCQEMHYSQILQDMLQCKDVKAGG